MRGRRANSIVAGLGAVAAGGALAVGGSAATTGSAQAQLRITDLGALSGGTSAATALNERGQIVGESTIAGGRTPEHAFLWQSGRLRDLGTVGRDLGGDLPNVSTAVAINERGQVLGNGSVDQNTPVSFAFIWQQGRLTALTSRGQTSSVATAISDRGQAVGWRGNDLGYGRGRAVSWQNGKTTDLGALPGREHSWARAVNERGEVVGESYSIDDAQDGLAVRVRAFLWRDGRMIGLGVLPGDQESSAVAINERGHVVGTSSAADGVGRGFLWRNGRLTDLGKIQPVALNDRGQVVANMRAFGEDGRAFLWQNGKRIPLGTLGGKASEATAINERGQVVGSSQTRTGAWHAFLWQNGKMIDLGTLGGKQSRAVAINERGRIVGSSDTRTGRSHAVVWSPPPAG